MSRKSHFFQFFTVFDGESETGIVDAYYYRVTPEHYPEWKQGDKVVVASKQI